MGKSEISDWQRILRERGQNVSVDGDFGPKTLSASKSLITSSAPVVTIDADLPWIVEAKKVIGLHEDRNHAELSAWLRSDGHALGDPSKLPWCGDFVETSMRLGLPSEPFPGALGANPYFARNWRSFGIVSPVTYGAVMAFERGPTSGHVGYCVGESIDRTAWMILGGNQGDRVGVVPISKPRLLSSRWPSTFPVRPVHLPRIDPNSPLSTNES